VRDRREQSGGYREHESCLRELHRRMNAPDDPKLLHAPAPDSR
jgi:hypothetical protein